ncbi:glucose-6-phosphate dehydrogenase [Paenibacillus hunanensis]|uniref:glucose-6-phosphate dehydrogenase n=1 Tax=Paenibacillus hunanensis TaxID=539262 RepID=UPI002A6B459B|nr:glucose-6-phosphate dehydrogenase [Paenibacillus hunanensis]WPP41118.1 glucose-6-phosphate dehydrogenase [Paenibacillus hunanensis]
MEAMTFVLFGSTGDLAKRKIFPALYNLYVDRKMPEAFSIIGLGRKSFNDATFQTYVEQSLQEFSRNTPNDRKTVDAFLRSIRYHILNVDDTAGYQELLKLVEQRESELNIPQNRMFYMSVAPEFFGVIADNINASGLGNTSGWKRLIIEKPFGHDLESARQLNKHLSKTFAEEEVFRIDHYLGKPMVQNMESFTSANPVIQSLWNNRHIANVQITASEVVGVEERAGYYDHTGAIRDMVQNHMLQVLMMTAMTLPGGHTADDVRSHKKYIAKALRPISKEDAHKHIVRAQYVNGVVSGREVQGYQDEPGIELGSNTDTFVAARVWVDDFSWEGVPFYIRTGKRMKEKSTRIVIEFKNTMQNSEICVDCDGQPNMLTISINPEEKITLQLNRRNVKTGLLEPMTSEFVMGTDNDPEAYELLIGDALNGDGTFFAHWDEVELSWQWVQPILEAFADNSLPLHDYAAGTYGPEASDALLAEQGFRWLGDQNAAPVRTGVASAR